MNKDEIKVIKFEHVNGDLYVFKNEDHTVKNMVFREKEHPEAIHLAQIILAKTKEESKFYQEVSKAKVIKTFKEYTLLRKDDCMPISLRTLSILNDIFN